jgi:hypothetical protein
MPTKQENGPLADKGLVERLRESGIKGGRHWALFQEAADTIERLAALSAQPAGDATDGEGALKAIVLAEKISGRGDDKLVSLTPHGWEYIYSAFDACRAALRSQAQGASE